MSSTDGVEGDVPIHPDLKLEARFAKATGMLLILAGAIALSFGITLLGISTGMMQDFVKLNSPPPLVGWLVLATCFLVAFLLLYYGRHLWGAHQHRLRRASWLLQYYRPRKMQLVFDLSDDMPGKTAELRAEGRSIQSAPDERIEIRSPHWKISDFAPQTVDVYQELDPEGIIVLVTSFGILWGVRQYKDFPTSNQ